MSLLRMYLEPPEISGKAVKPNIAVALNVLQEHRQKIAIAKVFPPHFIMKRCKWKLPPLIVFF